MRGLMAVVIYGRRTFEYAKSDRNATLKLRYYRLAKRQETGSHPHHRQCSLRHTSLRPSFPALHATPVSASKRTQSLSMHASLADPVHCRMLS